MNLKERKTILKINREKRIVREEENKKRIHYIFDKIDLGVFGFFLLFFIILTTVILKMIFD